MKRTQRHISFLILTVCFLSANVAIQQKAIAEESNTEWNKHDGQFGAMLLLTNKPEDFLQSWEKTTEGVPIHTTSSVTKGVPIVAFVLFSGCSPDENGLCDASVNFTVLRPDGSEYANFEDMELWKRKPAVERNMLQLSVGYIGVIIEPNDPFGDYRIRASVYDQNAQIRFDLIQGFSVLENNAKEEG